MKHNLIEFKKVGRAALLVGMGMLLAGSIVQAAKISDVRATKHNLSAAADGSATPSGTVNLAIGPRLAQIYGVA